MPLRTYLLLSSVIFEIAALAHLLRSITGAAITLGNWTLPEWVSMIVFVVLQLLAIIGFRHATRSR